MQRAPTCFVFSASDDVDRVDQAAAAGIHDGYAGLHQRECFTVDEVMILRGERAMRDMISDCRKIMEGR